MTLRRLVLQRKAGISQRDLDGCRGVLQKSEHRLPAHGKVHNLRINFVEPEVIARMTISSQSRHAHTHHADAQIPRSAAKVCRAGIVIEEQAYATEPLVVQGGFVMYSGFL